MGWGWAGAGAFWGVGVVAALCLEPDLLLEDVPGFELVLVVLAVVAAGAVVPGRGVNGSRVGPPRCFDAPPGVSARARLGLEAAATGVSD